MPHGVVSKEFDKRKINKVQKKSVVPQFRGTLQHPHVSMTTPIISSSSSAGVLVLDLESSEGVLLRQGPSPEAAALFHVACKVLRRLGIITVQPLNDITTELTAHRE